MTNFKIYTASAGAGKTYALVKEYLIKCLSSNDLFPYSKILAITFTNKAAAEMKTRILETLSEFERDENVSLLNDIAKATGLKKDIIKKKSKQLLFSILHNYSRFWIGTIDKFTYQIARSFSKDLDIPINAELELEENKIISPSVDILLSKIGEDEILTNSIVKYIKSKTKNEKSWNIERELIDFSRYINKEKSLPFIQKLGLLKTKDYREIEFKLLTCIASFEKETKELASNSLKNIIRIGVDFSSFSRQLLPNYYLRFTKKKAFLDNKFDVSETLKNQLKGENNFYSALVSTEQKNLINQNHKSLIIDFNALNTFLSNQKPNYILAKIIYKNIFSLSILTELLKIKNNYKKENNIVELSEFNNKISNIIKSEPVPFIYEKIGERFSHFLIDEFQDTSFLQWNNLLPLISNAIANTHDSCSLFGDAKQSIYRWRNSNVNQFLHLSNQIEKTLSPQKKLPIKKEVVDLKYNWRSDSQIVQFNNMFFNSCSNLIRNKIYQALFKNSFQKIPNKNLTGKKKGFVHLEYLDSDNLKENNLIKTLKHINKLKKHYLLKEIAIIVRKNNDANLLANYLTDNNINVISSDSLLLTNDHKVNIVIDVLHLVIDNNNKSAKTNIITNCLYLSGQYNINDLLLSSINKFSKELSKNNILLHFQDLGRLPLYDAIEEIISGFNWSSSNDSYLQTLSEVAYKFQMKNSTTINSFLNWWEENHSKQAIKSPKDIDAIKILTIHKAKGLEFPVVIFPFANWNAKVEPNSPKEWIKLNKEFLPLSSALVNIQKNLTETNYASTLSKHQDQVELDNLNLLYVILTRPINSIYIFTSEKGKNDISNYFKYFLSKNGLSKDEKTIYTFGKETIKKKKRHLNKIKEILPFNHVKWSKDLQIAISFNQKWDIKSIDNKKNWGLIIHQLFELLKDKSKVNYVIQTLVKKEALNKEEEEKLTKKVMLALQLNGVEKYFDDNNTILIEKEILLKDGSSFRPDRVLLNKKNAYIIDFKTGEENENHFKQVDNYAALISSMGYNIKERSLLYFDSSRIISNW